MEVGILEYWNNGIVVKILRPNIPAFHHSNTPGGL
jgi:hypothetical protein